MCQAFTQIGDTAHTTRTYTQDDISAFVGLTYDDNPLHGDDKFASGTRYGRPVVHGMLYAAIFSAIVGQRCPGSVYVSQSLNFRSPVFLGDTLTAEIEVRRIGGRGRLLDFATRCSNQDDKVVLDGEARVLMPHYRT